MNRFAPASLHVKFRSHPRARRYTLRLARGGDVVVTIPRGACTHEAMRFVNQHRGWIAEQRARRAGAAGHACEWNVGTWIHFRGEQVELSLDFDHGRPVVVFGRERTFIADAGMNLRRPVQAHLIKLARAELPARTRELAAELGVEISRVIVRDQSSRWGSCSETGEISLNWRLIQTPASVLDYLVIHELMHRREMNHSDRFWRHVAEACPDWRQAEEWLNRHALELGF